MKIRPLHDRVIVKRVDAETRTASGIYIPEAAGEKPDQGVVLAVGPGKRDEAGKLIPMDVKVGDAFCSASIPARTLRSTGTNTS